MKAVARICNAFPALRCIADLKEELADCDGPVPIPGQLVLLRNSIAIPPLLCAGKNPNHFACELTTICLPYAGAAKRQVAPLRGTPDSTHPTQNKDRDETV
ncbi:MAG: hypothetical protein LAO08_02845 [Acidobacteriia bacterium]|nr:hypothetical protein [Terriglobia bacterium]